MIKKFLTYGALALGLIAGSLLLSPVEAQYGGHGTSAPKYTTANLPTCSTAVNAGRLAWDTTTTSFKICDGSAWVESGTFGGSTITIGTQNTLARFGAADLEDSGITDNDITIALNAGGQIQFLADGTAANGRWILADVPDAGSSEILNDFTATLSIMDGAADVQTAFNIGLTNVDHTNGNVNALLIAGITQDANATEIGVNIEAGWDQAIRLDDGSATDDTITFGASADAEIYWDNANGRFAVDATDAATGGSVRVTWSDVDGNGLQLSQAATLVHTFAGLLSTTFTNPANMVNFGQGGTIGNMDGTDTWNVLRVDVVNGNHTGDTNTLNLLFLDAIAGDAEANLNAILIGALTGTAPTAGEVETAINIGAGWDHSLSILADGSATDDNITLGASQTADAQIYFTGTALTFDLDGTATNDFNILLGSGPTAFFAAQNVNNSMAFIAQNAAGAGLNLFELSVGSIAELSSDIVNLLVFDLNDAEFDTAGGSTFNFMIIEAFTPDDNVIYNGINIAAITGGTLTETAINIGAGWNYGLSILDDGSATLSAITLGNSATADAQIYFNSTDLVIDMDGASTNGVRINIGNDSGGSADFGIFGGPSADNELIFNPRNPTNSGENLLALTFGSIGTMDGDDTVTMIALDWNDTSFGAAGDLVQGINIEAVTTDTDVNYIGYVQLGAGDRAWDLAASFDAAVELGTYRQDFDGPCLRFAVADHTIEDVADGSINGAICDGGITNFTYRLELAQASPFLTSVTGQGLDIENDGADNAGVEIILAVSQDGTTDSGWYIRGQSPAMFVRFNVTLASVSGTDELVLGWRQEAAFGTTATWSDLVDTYAIHHVNDNVGNLTIETDVNGVGIGSDENAVNAAWADAETITLEVQLSTACVATFYTDGVNNSVTNANDACEAGDIMYPFIGYRLTSDVDLEAVINWIEIGEVI